MFTSRLPVSTVRRPSQPHDSNRSNIPATVRKANLFTPQPAPKQRPSSFGPSTLGKSVVNTDKKYQRPSKQLPDKDQQAQIFENLVNFLKEHAPRLPLPDPRRFFSSVSTTESTRIFQCLIEKLLPDFKINKLEVDVPEALATLSYPYIRSVTKSSLISVTTRQAVLGLLFIFQWLMNEIEAQNSVFDPDEFRGVVYEPLRLFRSQPEDARQAAEQRVMELLQEEDGINLEEELERTNSEFNDLPNQIEEVHKLLENQQVVREDNTKCEKYSEELKVYKDRLLGELNDLKTQVANPELRSDFSLKRLEKLKWFNQNHEFKESEAQDINDNLNKLNSEIKELRLRCDEETITLQARISSKENNALLRDEACGNYLQNRTDTIRLLELQQQESSAAVAKEQQDIDKRQQMRREECRAKVKRSKQGLQEDVEEHEKLKIQNEENKRRGEDHIVKAIDALRKERMQIHQQVKSILDDKQRKLGIVERNYNVINGPKYRKLRKKLAELKKGF